MFRANRVTSGGSNQLTGFVLLLPVLHQLGKDTKLVRAVCLLEILGYFVADDFGFVFERDRASL